MNASQTLRLPGQPGLALDKAGQGELLIFLHGIGGNRENWRRQVASFAETHCVVAWDARGYGDSDDYEGALDFSDFAVQDPFGAATAHLCGLSMGGRIAQDFYALFPDRVASLILVATHAGFADFSEEERRRFVELRRKPLVEDGKEPSDIAPVVARSLIGPYATEAQFQELVASMSKLHKESYIKTVEATTHFNRIAELANISVPTLLIYGEHDPLTTREMGEDMHKRIPGSDLVLVPKAGHLINLEQPAAFDTAVRDFLTRHKGKASRVAA